ncbi:MAG: 2-dehydropantoate 2-reductase [Anaerolineae bacterium]|nr:2-dehydropantoate 2-reductase [Anaerolineae bacterium]
MRFLVYGAGAVGSYLGVMLAHQGHDVTLLTRPATAELLVGTAMRVTLPGDQVIWAEPELATGVRRVFEHDVPFDVILLTVKSYDVEAALNPLVAFAPRPYPTIITLQNGIGLEELVQEALEDATVIAGSLTAPLSRETPDHVRVERDGRGLGLAPTAQKQKIKPYVALFNEAGITTESFRDYREMKWSKALLNMVGNATSAIINRHPRLVYETKATYALEMKMLSETLRVMAGLGLSVVDLPGAPAKRLASAVRAVQRWSGFLVKPALTRIVGEGRGNKMPSFHIDLAEGKRKNEVIYHNGAVASAGSQLGIPTPVNRALTDILMKLVRREIDWELYDGNPGQLVHDVEAYVGRSTA